MYKIIIAVFLAILIIGSMVEAKEKCFINTIDLNGTSEIYEFLNFEKQKFTLEVRKVKAKEKIELYKLQVIAFDTAIAIPIAAGQPDGFDLLIKSNGDSMRIILSSLDKNKISYFANPGNGKLSKLDIDSISVIQINKEILNVERLEFGEGFNLLSNDDEYQLSAHYANDILNNSNILIDTIIQKYVDSLGKHISQYSRGKNKEYVLYVVNTDDVNAYTVGGGFIFLNRGLIEHLSSEAELAGVIAHEIGHVVGRHTAKQLSKQLLHAGILSAADAILKPDKNEWGKVLLEVGGAVSYFSQMKYSRDDEREADFLAFYNVYEAGINPSGMTTLFEGFKRLGPGNKNILDEWSASHPNPEERMSNTETELNYIDAEGLINNSDRFKWIKDYITALPAPVYYKPIWIDTVEVKPGNIVYLKMTYPLMQTMLNGKLNGRFVASGGPKNDIRFIILDELNFINFSNGNKHDVLFDTDKVTIYDIDYKIPQSNVYYLVFDNTDSWITPKNVVIAIYLEYTIR